MGFDMELSIFEDSFHGSYTISVLYGLYEVLQKIYLGELYVYGEHEIRREVRTIIAIPPGSVAIEENANVMEESKKKTSMIKGKELKVKEI